MNIYLGVFLDGLAVDLLANFNFYYKRLPLIECVWNDETHISFYSANFISNKDLIDYILNTYSDYVSAHIYVVFQLIFELRFNIMTALEYVSIIYETTFVDNDIIVEL